MPNKNKWVWFFKETKTECDFLRERLNRQIRATMLQRRRAEKYRKEIEDAKAYLNGTDTRARTPLAFYIKTKIERNT